MAMSRAQEFNQLIPGLNALFGLEYKQYPNQHAEIFEAETSDRSFEEELKLAGLGVAPVKSEGSAIHYDRGQEAWKTRYDFQTIAMGFALTEEAMEDNLYESLGKRYTKALARSMAYTKQLKGASVINNAFSSSFTGGDNVSLINTAHPLVSGGTNSNRPAVAVDLNEAALEQAVIDIAAWTDERGLLIAARPMKLCIPPALEFVATRILESQLRVATADNDTNALRNNGSIPQGWTINNFFTDPNAWFLKTDVPDGLKHFTRTPMKTGMDVDFDTGNARYKARERYGFGWTDPLSIYGSPGSN